MKLYHAPSQRIEELPPDRGPVKLYALGLAAYPVMGLRQAVIYTVVDCFIRYLHFQGRPVTYFQDTTHLDDTIGRHAAHTGADEFALRRAWAVHLLADMQALNLHPPADCLLATKGAQPAVEVVLRNTAAVGFRLQIPLATSRVVRPTGNAVALRDLLACYSPNVLRFFWPAIGIGKAGSTPRPPSHARPNMSVCLSKLRQCGVGGACATNPCRSVAM